MTTKTRRTQPQQASDILGKLLRTQEALAAKRKAQYEEAEAKAARTRAMIAAIDQLALPGMEESAVGVEVAPGLTIFPVPDDAAVCPACGGKRPWHYDGCATLPVKMAIQENT